MSAISLHALAAVFSAIVVVPAFADKAPRPGTDDSATIGEGATIDDDAGSFSLVPAEGRHLKIDRRSGAVSICAESGGSWSCRLVADDRIAFEDEIERLQAENRRLETKIAELEKSLVDKDKADEWIDPEDERKLEEFLQFSDKAMRRFFGLVQDLKRDLEAPDSL